MVKKSKENQQASMGVNPPEQATEMVLEPGSSAARLPSLAQALLCFAGIITAIAGGLFGLGISLHALMFLCIIWTSLHAFFARLSLSRTQDDDKRRHFARTTSNLYFYSDRHGNRELYASGYDRNAHVLRPRVALADTVSCNWDGSLRADVGCNWHVMGHGGHARGGVYRPR